MTFCYLAPAARLWPPHWLALAVGTGAPAYRRFSLAGSMPKRCQSRIIPLNFSWQGLSRAGRQADAPNGSLLVCAHVADERKTLTLCMLSSIATSSLEGVGTDSEERRHDQLHHNEDRWQPPDTAIDDGRHDAP